MKKLVNTSENLNISNVDNKTIKCKWCDKRFKPIKKLQTCCNTEHDSKYNNYLSNDFTENPWDKHIKDNYKYSYYQ